MVKLELTKIIANLLKCSHFWFKENLNILKLFLLVMPIHSEQMENKTRNIKFKTSNPTVPYFLNH